MGCSRHHFDATHVRRSLHDLNPSGLELKLEPKSKTPPTFPSRSSEAITGPISPPCVEMTSTEPMSASRSQAAGVELEIGVAGKLKTALRRVAAGRPMRTKTASTATSTTRASWAGLLPFPKSGEV